MGCPWADIWEIGCMEVATIGWISYFLAKFLTFTWFAFFYYYCWVSLLTDTTGVKVFCLVYLSICIYVADWLAYLSVLTALTLLVRYYLLLFLSFSFYLSNAPKHTLLIGVSWPVSLMVGDCIFLRSYIISPPFMPPAARICPSSLKAMDVNGS